MIWKTIYMHIKFKNELLLFYDETTHTWDLQFQRR